MAKEEEHPGGIRYYTRETEDFVENSGQDAVIPADYRWLRLAWYQRIVSVVSYGLSAAFGMLLSRFSQHARIVNGHLLKECRTGYFLYGNHTQPLGDVFTPARYVFPKRMYAVAGAANYGIPVIGKLLPFMGALAVPGNMSQMKEFLDSLQYHIAHGRPIIVYPEAHVWPYCTFIRPFEATSFRFPVLCHAPAYCMTTTYQRRRRGKKPRVTVYIDGPFTADPSLSSKAAQRKLHDEIADCMKRRSAESTYEYIRYEKKPEPDS